MKQNTASQRIASEIRAKIRSGALAPGDRAPSARQIVRQHGVALATATKVLGLLRREGLVRARPGVGTVVIGERTVDLSRERIVSAAIAICDDDGTEALSMRTLARELGVATMSLYGHVRSREELLAVMVDAVLGESPLPRRESSVPWRPRLEQIARALWEIFRRHPWLARVLSMTRPHASRQAMRNTDAVLDALMGIGLSPTDTLRIGVSLIALIRGMAGGLEAERRDEQDTGITSSEWMHEHETEFARYLADAPTLAELVKTDVTFDTTALFECSLGCILDGIERRSGARARPSGRTRE